jgi:hypothetical protein
MTSRARQRDSLQSTIAWARQIEQHLALVRDRHLGGVHFRPSSTSVSMIGLHPDRPQRGKSSITNLARLAATFDAEFRRHCIDCDHGRPTPEKRLQSHLLANAYRHDRRMPDLHVDGAPPLTFVTDELSLPLDTGRIVCDLLALHGDRPAAIELKPGREMTRLVEQVTRYAALVDEHIDLFAELFTVVLGRTMDLHYPCERWIVWPHPRGHDRDPREDELASLGIRVVGYEENDGAFMFRVGRSPE